MSGTGDGSLIATTRNAELQVLGTGGQLAVQAWDQISGYLRRARSPAHAALFAEPNPDADRGITDWYAAGRGEAPPLETLPEAAQETARAEFARLYGDIREEVERLRASTRESERFLGELIALALITPATDCLRVVGGQPVLVAWGHAKLGEAPSPELLIGMTRRRGGGMAPMQIIGPPPAPPAKRPWLFWLLGLLGFLLLLLLLLLLWRDPFGWFRATLPQCVVQPGNMQLLDELRAAEAREAALRADIAREMLRLGDRRTACPPPEPPPPPPRRVEQPPPPPPPPRQEDAERARREGARSGRVQIILAWDDRNDLDLMMICPNGERLFFDNRRACGAELDVDRNAGNSGLTPTPVENIVFAAEPAPGRYRIIVWHFQNNPPAPASSPYRVTVKREGRPDQAFTGRVAAGQQVEVGHFDVP
ncbi:MAG: hypothetical protein ING09_10700 [Roseomonas sp.]|nr:hypothetical protein [Roseomonas sp.]MCA3289013.1 hypothetical protein [Roseomonas sp.]MCA3293615.1 hypothetical protein [Roseomonas sp.]